MENLLRKMQCMICSGVEILKNYDGTFHCQSCGCQYSLKLEEAPPWYIGLRRWRDKCENCDSDISYILTEYTRVIDCPMRKIVYVV